MSVWLQGDVSQEIHGIPFRLANDFDILAWNKQMIHLCQFLRRLATDNGLSEVELCDHLIQPRMLEAGSWVVMLAIRVLIDFVPPPKSKLVT